MVFFLESHSINHEFSVVQEDVKVDVDFEAGLDRVGLTHREARSVTGILREGEEIPIRSTEHLLFFSHISGKAWEVDQFLFR